MPDHDIPKDLRTAKDSLDVFRKTDWKKRVETAESELSQARAELAKLLDWKRICYDTTGEERRPKRVPSNATILGMGYIRCDESRDDPPSLPTRRGEQETRLLPVTSQARVGGL